VKCAYSRIGSSNSSFHATSFRRLSSMKRGRAMGSSSEILTPATIDIQPLVETPLVVAIIICIFTGVVGGAACSVVVTLSLPAGLMLGGIFGLIFAVLCHRRAVSPGAGLIWGLGFALLLWLVVPAGVVHVIAKGTSAIGR